MTKSGQISVAGLMVLFALCAIALSPASIVTWILIELVLIFAFVRLLVGNLPFAIRKAQMHNCVRADGSWSNKREAIENSKVRKLMKGMFAACVLVAIPTNMLLWYVNSELIPISIGMDAVGSLVGGESDWKSNLRDESLDLGRWWKSKRSASKSFEAHRDFLWNYWPLILMGCLVWVGIAFSFLWRTYYRALEELEHSIVERARFYRLRDFAQDEQSRTEGVPAGA